jgi:hypothetical protein
MGRDGLTDGQRNRRRAALLGYASGVVRGRNPRRTLLRGLIVLGLAGLASLVLSFSAAAARSDSIKVVLAKHIRVGQPTVIELAGYASGKKPEVWLYSQPQKCPSTLNAEIKFSNETIWIDGGRVNGHYKYKDPIKYPESTHGRLNFCAYLTYFGPDFSFITSAHESRQFRVPS